MDQLLLREMMNAGEAMTGFFLALVFIMYLWPRMKVKGWYNDKGNQGAVALSVLFIGDAIRRAWTVLLLWRDRFEGVTTWMVDAAFPFSVFGFLLATAGALCAMRIFSNWQNRWWPWRVAAIGIIGSCLAVLWVG